MSLLCVGSIALDDIETPFGKMDGVLGGSAVYFSLAARFFTDVRVAGIVGRDFPAKHLDGLAARGIDVSEVERSEGKTFRWSGEYLGDMSGATTRAVELGVFGEWKPKLTPRQRSASHVFLANSSPRTQAAALDQMESPVFTAADTMNLWIERDRAGLLELLSRVDCLFINDGEARMLASKSSLVSCGREIVGMGPSTVIIKKGEHGSIMFDGGRILPLPAFPAADVVDPTGAGDSFAGGFVGFASGAGRPSPESAARSLGYATVTASFTVSRFGTGGLDGLSRAEIDERYAAFRRMFTGL